MNDISRFAVMPSRLACCACRRVTSVPAIGWDLCYTDNCIGYPSRGTCSEVISMCAVKCRQQSTATNNDDNVNY